MPPAPPCTSSTSSGCRAATMNTLDHTVHATSGSAAASTRSTPVRHRHQLPGRHRHLGGVGAGGQQRARLVAHRPALDAVADGGDGPAALHAEHVGRPGRRRVEALPLQQVGPVEAGGGDVEHHLARPGLGVGDVAHDEDLGTAGPVGEDGRTQSDLVVDELVGRGRPRSARRCGRPCCRRGRGRRRRRGRARRPAGPSPRPAPAPGRPAPRPRSGLAPWSPAA